jgi:hypothetical protein
MQDQKVDGKKHSVISISNEAREDYAKVQTLIGARTQSIALSSVMGWLMSGDADAQAALQAIAQYRVKLAQAELASAA